METDRWQRAKDLFGSALEREPGQRNAFLAEACGEDESLRQEVESLLTAHQDAATTMGGTGLSESLGAQSAPEDLVSGRRIGSYQVLRRIGLGGMAAVYLAVRADDQYKKRVAIKLILPGLDSEDLLRRFRNERQTLAALDHPNIVKLLDGGSTEDGLPYLVMDYVEGTPLDEYCDHHKLSIEERLQLFRTVCAAVSYAHQRLVIHRDLKPGNILVTADGTPKLLDFGIAKLLNPEAAATLVVTRTGQRAMTPEYASPEQVRGEPLTNATDIYSLGVVLYELLTGHRLYRLKTHAMGEMEQAICEQEPVKPSTVVTRAEEEILPDGTTRTTTPEEISRLREGDPKKLRSRLHGDLDAIVLTALRKEPQRRYASVHESAEDIRRHLEHLSVKARPSTITYRVAKFLRRHREGARIALAVVVLAVSAIGGFLYLHRAHALTEKDTIVLADFANSTGNAIFDDTLKTALTISLQQSPFLNVLSDSQVAKTLQQMTRSADTRLTPELARELCLRARSKAYIAGSIDSLGSEYVLGLKAVNCQNGDTLAQAQVTAAAKERVVDELGRAASRLRGELGESLATVQKFDIALVQATTSSLEALKAYSLGRRADNEKGPAAALTYGRRAIELDPNFALGYNEVGWDYFNLGQLGRASEYFTKAFQLREHASEWERLAITANYYANVTGELDKAAQTYQEGIESYPREPGAYANLGLVYTEQGQYEKAAEITRQVLRLAPDRLAWYNNLANYSLALQRFDETRLIIHEAQTRKMDDLLLHNALYVLAFLGTDSAAMGEQQQWFARKPEYENVGLALASDTEAYGGHLGKARELTKRAVESAVRADNKESGAIYLANAALQQAAYANAAEARQSAAEALKLGRTSQGVESEAALAFAMVGDTARAESLAQDLGKRFPLDTQMQSLWLPAIQAQLALDKKNSATALNALQAASAIELGQIVFANNGSCLYHVYVRGEAYLASGQGSAAAAEFQKILDHSGIVWNCWTGALAHLGVARASALEARTSQGADANVARVRAIAAYKDFLTFWRDADPDVPILQQAKAEYAKLQQSIQNGIH